MSPCIGGVDHAWASPAVTTEFWDAEFKARLHDAPPSLGSLGWMLCVVCGQVCPPPEVGQ